MSESGDDAALREIAERLRECESAVAFTGAGISTESGITDFRSPGGVWSRHQPVYFHDFLASHEARVRYWSMKKEAHPEFASARPNVAHEVLARLERDGPLRAVITQNIDGLHREAGSEHVLELHGNGRIVMCLECPRRYPAGEIFERMERESIDVPTCDDCGGLLKPATVSFGQNLPHEVFTEAELVSRTCGVYLSIGSSLVVQPAAGLPVLAKQHGAYLAIINREPTPIDGLADRLVRTPIGDALRRIDELYGAA